MDPVFGPLVLLFSTVVFVEPYQVDEARPNLEPPITHLALPDNVNTINVKADGLVLVFAAHEEHQDVVVEATLDRTLNGEWGKFVACGSREWESCDMQLGPFEADITDVYLVSWQPFFTDTVPPATLVNVTAARAEEINVRPVVNVDVEIDLFDWFLRRLLGR